MTIQVEREDVNRVLTALTAMEAADAHYKACQSPIFRSFAVAQIRAPSLLQATDRLREACAASVAAEKAPQEGADRRRERTENARSVPESRGDDRAEAVHEKDTVPDADPAEDA